ncbi:MAG: bifunctional metallophosphatase/5'-nucleotidase [Pseudomonadota bacterium]|nr:bifunctional metallophosphatase/5'-nucleotidase [Pseudomonadota bacterium]
MRIWPIATLLLAGCTTTPRPVAPGPVEVQILGINDFHGNLEPPKNSVDATLADGRAVKVPAGGVAYLAGAAKALRAGQPYSMTVSAGDMIGASPLVSALYLDEPTIAAMNAVGVDYNAVGNHEFDKGSAELLRMQRGGCEKYTNKAPCAVELFAGASFGFLAANVVRQDGTTLFPGTAMRDFGPVQVGFIGMTLKETATLVTPAGVAGLTFADEAATANAAVPALKLAGADAIVLLIHQGGRSSGGYNDKSCPGFDGDIVPILEKLDPAIDVVVSGHTHAAYICERARAGARPLLLTSAGRYGTLISDIRLTIDPARGVVAHRADNVIVQGEGFSNSAGAVAVVPALPVYARDSATQAIVDRYVAASAEASARVVGRLSGPVNREASPSREISGGNFIADAQLAATRGQGAQIAFTNSGGVRADLIPGPGGVITYGQIFAMQPFGNNLVVKTLTGAQLKAVLEQQFESGSNTVERPNMLLPSNGFAFAYDLSRPAGSRIVEMTLDGQAIDPAAKYRVTVVNFLASGGDNFTVLTQGMNAVDAGLDLDATEAYLRSGGGVPDMGRIRNLTPAGSR